jgi:hypothetical protein
VTDETDGVHAPATQPTATASAATADVIFGVAAGSLLNCSQTCHGASPRKSMCCHIEVNCRHLAGLSAATHRCRGDAGHRAPTTGAGKRARRFHEAVGNGAAAGLVALGCAAPAQAQVFRSSASDLAVETAAKGLTIPGHSPSARWPYAGQQRPGRIRTSPTTASSSALPACRRSSHQVRAACDVALDRGWRGTT